VEVYADKPTVRCLIAFPLGDGRVSRTTHLVDLEEAAWRQKEGWWVVVDPADLNMLAAWERERSPYRWNKW
jgi:hypothetical protein